MRSTITIPMRPKRADQIASPDREPSMWLGHVAGRMEFGPRALGSRSILGDARSPKMQEVMNLKIKFRESFRPFAPAVLREDVDKYFEMRPNEDSPYMLLVAPVREDRLTEAGRRIASGDRSSKGLERLQELRSEVPAITHVDNSARVQTIDDERNPRFARIIRAFKEKTGSSVVINTSFNVRGEPIVCTPSDAFRCFMHTNMDVLVLENFILLKQEQPEAREIDQGRLPRGVCARLALRSSRKTCRN